MSEKIKTLKSGHLNEKEILENLTTDMLFERIDGTKVKITSVDDNKIIINTLDIFGKEIDETRNFSKKVFASLIRSKHFEPTTIKKMETFSDLNKKYNLGLRKNFK